MVDSRALNHRARTASDGRAAETKGSPFIRIFLHESGRYPEERTAGGRGESPTTWPIPASQPGPPRCRGGGPIWVLTAGLISHGSGWDPFRTRCRGRGDDFGQNRAEKSALHRPSETAQEASLATAGVCPETATTPGNHPD